MKRNVGRHSINACAHVLLTLLVSVLVTTSCEPPGSEPAVYKTVDGKDLQLAVWQPTAAANGRTLFFIHGGALMHGNRWAYPEHERAWWLQHGYRLISVDYRLAPEYRLRDIFNDLQDAYTWVREKGPEKFGVDPQKIVVMGQSAGGYLALTCGYAFKPVPRAVVDYYGYSRIDAPWMRGFPIVSLRVPPPISDARHALLAPNPPEPAEMYLRQVFSVASRTSGTWTEEVVGSDCSAGDHSCFQQFNPVEQVTARFAPTIIFHGTDDIDVPIRESEDMAEQLEASGVFHRLVKVSGHGHGFDTSPVPDPVVPASFEAVDRFITELLAP